MDEIKRRHKNEIEEIIKLREQFNLEIQELIERNRQTDEKSKEMAKLKDQIQDNIKLRRNQYGKEKKFSDIITAF